MYGINKVNSYLLTNQKQKHGVVQHQNIQIDDLHFIDQKGIEIIVDDERTRFLDL